MLRCQQTGLWANLVDKTVGRLISATQSFNTLLLLCRYGVGAVAFQYLSNVILSSQPMSNAEESLSLHDSR